jgi:hypothetical protein
LFIDELEGFMADRVPNSGARVGSDRCQMLLYADDVVLFAETAADLQSQLNALKEFCDLKLMTVNVSKTMILSCRSQDAVGCSWHFAGESIEVVKLFKYLGNQRKGSGVLLKQCSLQLLRPCGASCRQAQERDIRQISLKVMLFKTIVLPVMSYGCEIWSLPFLRAHEPFANPVQKLQNVFLRQIGGAWMKKTVSQKLLHVKLGCMPVSFTWVKMACGSWNRLVTQRSSTMLHSPFAENLDMSMKTWT